MIGLRKETLPRNEWKRDGRIEKTYLGANNKTRVVTYVPLKE